uniref:Putative paramyosin n=1 Tax=Xenopsylla cheopis TaxID=163159 RepID=A0A6M2DWG6_XENCH
MRVTFALACAFLIAPFAVKARDVTHEDIRDAMLSMVHMVRSAEDKLERHEFRERALGEHVKKALAALEKRHNRLEPIKGTLTRLDERINSIETILIQRDERERTQLQKTAEALEKIEKALAQRPATSHSGQQPAGSQTLDQKLDAIATEVQMLTQELAVLKSGTEKLEDSTNKMNEKTIYQMQRTEDALSRAMNKSDEFLMKYENKLSEYLSKDANQQENEIVSVLKQTNSKMIDLLERNSNHHEQTTIGAPLDHILHGASGNATLEAIQEAKYAIISTYDIAVDHLYSKIEGLYESLHNSVSKMNSAIDEDTQFTKSAVSNIYQQYETLRGEVQGIGKVERVMLQTADNILDTKKRVEFGVHQIVMDVGNLVKLQSRELNSTVNRRFDELELTVLDNQSASLANLSAKIELEMSEVWRQIGIMSSQLTTSANALERLEAQTELYTNGSLQTMDNMEGKVGKITSRMGEVDENLNYLLGRLSLVMQEFNQVKSGLGNALDTIRSSFHEVQSKLKDAGPGPHNIPKSNEDVENQLN